MILLTRLVEWSVPAFAALFFAAELVAYEAGFGLGHRHASDAAARKEGTDKSAASVLALLAFMLALTLSFANDQFTATRDGTLREANAIDGAWFTAKAIGGKEGDAIATLLEQYMDLRIAFIKAGDDTPTLADIERRTSTLRLEIWKVLTTLLRADRSRPVAQLLTSLNDVFDATAAEQFHFRRRIPPEIFSLLVALTLLGMAMLGYEMAFRGPPMRVLAAVLAFVWVLVIVDIISLAWPRIGGVTPSADAYELALDGMRSAAADFARTSTPPSRADRGSPEP